MRGMVMTSYDMITMRWIEGGKEGDRGDGRSNVWMLGGGV
jgi:hypothetical protein